MHKYLQLTCLMANWLCTMPYEETKISKKLIIESYLNKRDLELFYELLYAFNSESDAKTAKSTTEIVIVYKKLI